MTLKVAGRSEPGTLVVENGELRLVPDGAGLPTVALLKSGDGNPFTLQSVTIDGNVVTLVGRIDVEKLLGI